MAGVHMLLFGDMVPAWERAPCWQLWNLRLLEWVNTKAYGFIQRLLKSPVRPNLGVMSLKWNDGRRELRRDAMFRIFYYCVCSHDRTWISILVCSCMARCTPCTLFAFY